MKLCKDCIYFNELFVPDPRGPFCKAPQSNPPQGVIYGHFRWMDASFCRATKDQCGPEATWFSQRPTPKRSWFLKLWRTK